MTRSVLPLILSFLACVSAVAQTPPQRQEVPRLIEGYLDALNRSHVQRPQAVSAGDTARVTSGRLWLSAPLAVTLGLGGTIAGLLAGYGIFDCSDEGPSCARGPDNAEGLGAAAGLFLRSSLGAHLGGLRRDSRGHVVATLLAAGAGSVLFALANLNYDGTGDNPSAVVALIATPLLAAVVNSYVRVARAPRRARTAAQ